MSKNNANERKGTARKLIAQSLMVTAVGAVVAGVPSYFALDYRSALVTLSEAAKSHDDELAAAQDESDKAKKESVLAKEARDAAAYWVTDLQADAKKRDEELAALQLKLEEPQGAPRESCVEVRRRHAAEVEHRLNRAACLRAWDPKERLWVGLAEGANDGQ